MQLFRPASGATIKTNTNVSLERHFIQYYFAQTQVRIDLKSDFSEILCRIQVKGFAENGTCAVAPFYLLNWPWTVVKNYTHTQLALLSAVRIVLLLPMDCSLVLGLLATSPSYPSPPFNCTDNDALYVSYFWDMVSQFFPRLDE